MPISSGELAQIVWAETSDLGYGNSDGTGAVNGVRRLLSQLAASTDGAGFEKRKSLPPVNDPRYGDSVRAVLEIAENSKAAVPPQSRLIIWEAGTDKLRPNQRTSPPPPPPWSTMPIEGITHQLRIDVLGGRLIDV